MLAQLLDKIRNRDASTEAPGDNLVPIAAATLLMEVAWADHDIADEELQIIRSALAAQFALASEVINDIIEESREHHDESVGLHRFTRTINDAWEEPQKFELVRKLWELALADESLDRFEEHMIRKIAELLYVSHPRFIEAKLAARAAKG